MNQELYHYGVKGMKWGVRRAQKKRSKYLDKTKRLADFHNSQAKVYSDNAKKLKNVSDKDYAKRYDDTEYLHAIGSAKKARELEIKGYIARHDTSIKYAKEWMKAHDAILNAPVGSLKSNKDYENVINDILNEDL